MYLQTTFGDIITAATGAMSAIMPAAEVSIIVTAAVGISLGVYYLRRAVKLGR